MTEQGEAEATPAHQLAGGLYDGFERYTTPNDDDHRAVMTGGLVVLDTNALLNLYRYTAAVRTALLDVLAKLGDQLWEPHQVILEFWPRRESAIRDYRTAARTFEDTASKAKEATTGAIRALGNRIGLGEEQKTRLVQPIEEAYAALSVEITETMNAGGATKVGRDTGADPVLLALEPVLRGRVGEPLESAAYQEALAEARRRIEAKEPPGYKDAAKRDGHAEGDYLVWAQILREAAARDRDVLFVTGDAKEDWWRSWDGIACAGPRFELLDEFHAATGRRLYMLQPAELLAKASEILQISVTQEEVAEARRVDRFTSGPGTLIQIRPSETGLSAAESVLLLASVRAALRRDNRLLGYLDWEEIKASAAQTGLSPDEIEEAREMLAHRLLIAVVGHGDVVREYHLTLPGFMTGFPEIDPRADQIRRRLIAELLEADLDGGAAQFDVAVIADRLDTEQVVIEQYLQHFKLMRVIDFVTTLGGHLLTKVSPALRLELD